jgi:hypothetical protein
MSSVLRSVSAPVRLATEFHRVETPTFNDGSNNVPFPFTYNNGTLDIADKNNFNAQMITSTGNEPNTDPDVSVRLMGGNRLVQHLGENFKAYIRAWRNSTIDADSPIEIFVNGTVQRIQWVNETNMGDSSYAVSTSPPSGDTYTQYGNGTYNSTWMFNKPLTISTMEGGVKTYITFTSRLDED